MRYMEYIWPYGCQGVAVWDTKVVRLTQEMLFFFSEKKNTLYR